MKTKSLFISILTITSLLIFACDSNSNIPAQIDAQEINLKVDRFERKFANASINDLENLKINYPYFFSSRIPDSIWIDRMRDPVQIEINKEVERVFRDFEDIEKDLNDLYKHLNYYKKDFKVPNVLTVTNFVDFRNKIIVTDTIVLIALDNFLGANHHFYNGIQKYLAKNFNQEQITVALADYYAEKEIIDTSKQYFLSEMIKEGKKLYCKDLLLPLKSDAEKIGYTERELEWARQNEANIWSYFIEEEVLYNSDPKLTYRFITPAPFSKFGLNFDNESPGRIGAYIGWQIVRAYANNNDVAIDKLMRTPAKEIFEFSKFKPNR